METRICQNCSCSIGNKHSTAKFCSISCKNSYWQVNNKDKVNKNAEKYRKSDKGQLYREINHDKINKQIKKWKTNNVDWQKELDKDYHKRNKDNKEYLAKRAHHEALRRARKLKATISGYESEILSIYENCPTGYHVDHIHPLKGKTVCGLHVPWNLRIITAEENLKKGNKLIEVENGKY